MNRGETKKREKGASLGDCNDWGEMEKVKNGPMRLRQS
jgi:hypothetical protein